MMEHSQPVSRDTPSNVRDTQLSENRFGTWFAETIRASGRVCRANRPDTRLLLTSAKLGSKMSCYAGAIHTGHSCIAQHFEVRVAATRDQNGLSTDQYWLCPAPNAFGVRRTRAYSSRTMAL